MSDPLIPDIFANYYSILAMLFVGIIVEENYVSRPTLFVNSAALLLHAKQFPEVGLSIGVFVILGLAAGIIGFITYFTGNSLPDGFYQFTFFTYSSAPIALLMVLTFLFSPNVIWLIIALAIGGVVNSKLLTLAPEYMAPVEQFDYPIRLADWLFGKDWRY